MHRIETTKGDGVKFLAGTAAELGLDLMTGLARYRHAVFVDMLKWELAAEHGLEFDQFDRVDTRYVAALDEAGHFIGVARLLPTTRPYLLGDVFPELMGDAPVPSADPLWELSRFAAVDFNTPRRTGQISSAAAIGLMHAAQRCAAEHGVERFITVSPPGVERLLQRAGFRVHRAGPRMRVRGYVLFACWIDMPAPTGPAADDDLEDLCLYG